MWVKPSLEYRRESLTDAAMTLFRLSGKMTGTRECYDFLDEARKFLHDGGRLLLIDVSAVERVTSPGVGILAALHTTATRANARIALLAVPDSLAKLLKIVLLWDLLPHYATLQEALAADMTRHAERPPHPGNAAQ